MGKNVMEGFIGKVILVDRGGPESRMGNLLDVSDDHIVLLTENDGVIYYNTHHIKSFTENLRGKMKLDINNPNEIRFNKTASFKDLLDSLKLQWVKINRGGPVKVEGLLSDVNKDYVCLICNDEIIRLSMVHIRNISLWNKN